MTSVSSPTTDSAARPMTAAARPPVPAAIRLGRIVSAIARYGFLLLVAAVIVVPIVYAVLGGFKDPAQLANDAIGLPNPWVVENYTDVLTDPSFWRQLANSSIIAGLSTILVVLFAALAAFVFARRAFPGREVLYTLFTLGLLFPAAVAILPLFILVRDLGLLDNPLGIALPEAAFGLPLTIVVLRPFFRSIPTELEDAASIDGCGSFGFFWRILLPLSRPALATVGVLAIVASWNQFLLPLVMLSDESHWTLPLGVTNFSTQYTTDTARILAYTTLALIPALVFYLFAERQLVGGLTQGSVKG
ncbi:MAG TPA: carbohydrate ABC transporter permease [Candidatus Limnocylindrales bacterium]|jgi:raffinose/stachyose/melibiose transport system permease protein|nr:carbohydrate ABC transporter permease [Candidatus Limnocylindrales bacterium]